MSAPLAGSDAPLDSKSWRSPVPIVDLPRVLEYCVSLGNRVSGIGSIWTIRDGQSSLAALERLHRGTVAVALATIVVTYGA
jgi:hypothetical protein